MEDLNPLLEKALEILRRDLNCLMQESAKGLSSTRSSSLTGYIKLLREIQRDDLKNEAFLKEQVEKIFRDINRTEASGSKQPA